VGLFTPQDLANIRGAFDTWLPDTGVIYQISKANTSNGVTKSRSARGAAKQCRFAELSGRELERAKQLAAEADCVLTFEANTTVEGTDEIDVTHAESGRTFTVQVEHVVRRSQEFKRTLYCKDLRSK
jgi:hypothetical protein